MITEYNYVYPNQFRSEGGALTGAYAALQDWDGLYRFSWAHNADIATKPMRPVGFDIANEPIGQMSEYIVSMFWRRGDMPSFQEEAVYVIGSEEAFAGKKAGDKPRDFEDSALNLGLTKKISTRYEANAPADGNPEFQNEKPRDRYAVEVDEQSRVILETAGDFLAETLQSKALVVQSRSLDENFVRDVTGGPATIFAGAVDDKPLAESRRVLILHLTNAIASNAQFASSNMNVVEGYGNLPLLIKRGAATIRVPDNLPGADAKLYAVDFSGKRVAEVPFKRVDGTIEFVAQSIAPDNRTTLAYELVR